MLKKTWSANAALMILVMGAMFVSLGIIIHGSLRDWQRGQEHLEDKALSVARFYQSRQVVLTTSTEVLLQTLAEIPLLNPGKEEELADFLRRLDVAQPDYMGFSVVNTQGEALASVGGGHNFPALTPERMQERDYFQVATRERRFSVGGGQASRREKNAMYLPMAVPVFDAKRDVQAVVVALLDMRRHAEDRQSTQMLALLKESGAQVRLLDKDGHILYQFPSTDANVLGTQPDSPSLTAAHATGSELSLFRHNSSSGEERVCVTLKTMLSVSTEPYLYVQVEMPHPRWVNFFFLNYYQALLAIGASLLFAIVVSRLAGRYFFLDGLARLVRVARLTREGRMDERNGVLQGCREIQTLGHCMDQMLDDLRQSTTMLREERSRLDMALNAAEMGIWEWVDTNSQLHLDERCWERLGYAPEASTRSNGLTVMHEEDMPTFMQARVRHLSGQTANFQCEIRLRRRDGEWAWLLFTGKRSGPATATGGEAKNGKLWDVGGVCLDITIRRQLEELEKEKAEYYKRLSSMDGLTGLWNRRHFDEAGLMEARRCLRYGHPLSVIMADVDHFKNVNDTYGHAAGDEVLRYFAALMRDLVRSSDMVARYGGEEFVLLLPETEMKAAVAVAEKIRVGLAGLPVPYEEVSISCNASFGVCSYQPDVIQFGNEPSEQAFDVLEWLVGQADAALYAAKGAGRNRVKHCVAINKN